MITTDSLRGRLALMAAHCAGMVDLVALPLWVGILMSHYRFDPQQAGGVVTLFLVGAVVASTVLASRFERIPRRVVVVVGFAAAALSFLMVAWRQDLATIAALHLVAGLSTGAALSVTHGTIARSPHPHRLYAIVSTALGVFAIGFFVAVPPLLARIDGTMLFQVFGGVMAVAAVASVLAFPQADAAAPGATPAAARARPEPLPRAVWFGIVGVGCMGLVQAMTFAFLERVGDARAFEASAIAGMLVAIGIINLVPAPVAGWLEHRVSARNVLLVGPAAQAVLAALIMLSTGFAMYAAGALFFAAVMIFTHTFAFGLLARLEPTGRALAATPAMVMTGAAIGPVLGGTLVKTFGYGSLALASAVTAAVAVFCFSQLPRQAATSHRRAIA